MKSILGMLLSAVFCTVLLADRLTATNPQTEDTAPGASNIKKFFNNVPWQIINTPGHGIRDTNELYWDDGVPEAYFLVSFPPGVNDRFAVRFNLPAPPPLKIIGGRFYTDNSVIPLKSFSVCPDAGGYPDVFHPIDKIDTVIGGYPGWGSYQFHGVVFDSVDIWAVLNWIPGYVVGVGADSTSPDGNSYWCSHRDAVNWNQWVATDWLMRLSVATITDSHDVTTTAILDPPGRFLPGDTADPTAIFGNCGLSSEVFDVTFDIADSANNLVYTSTNTISLLPGQTETLTFVPEWLPIAEGMYDYRVYTSMAGDADPANDTISRQGLCSSEIIITYCSDYTNMGEAIIGTWASNRKFLVRMTPPVPAPFSLRRAQIFLCNENALLEYVCVCPDNGSGLPDTTTIFAIARDISVPQANTWATAYFDEIEINYPGDLWVIAKWPEGITEPHIGLEINDPSTERSWRYYFKDGAGHYENMGLDPFFREWYFRLVIAVPPLTGTKERASENLSRCIMSCTPSPAKRSVLISFIVPNQASAEITICDVAGRTVRSFREPDNHLNGQVLWDGSNGAGKRVSAGVYFVQLKTADQKLSQKVVLIK